MHNAQSSRVSAIRRRSVSQRLMLFLIVLSSSIAHVSASDVTSHIEDLGVSTGTRWSKAPYARNPWDMQTFAGKIYIGSGNSSNYDPSTNAGPVPIISFDPKTGSFTRIGAGKYVADGRIGQEQIDVFHILNGKLYIGAHDPVGTCNETYIFDGTTWTAPSGVSRIYHTYFLAQHEGKIFAGLGPREYSSVAVSSNGGFTWSRVEGGENTFRIYSLLQVGDRLLACNSATQSRSYVLEYVSAANELVKREDLVTEKLFPGLNKSTSIKVVKPVRIGSSAVYIGGLVWNDHQFYPQGVWVADSIDPMDMDIRRLPIPDGSVPWDVIVKDGIIYVVSSREMTDQQQSIQVWQSTDRATVKELFSFTAPTFVRSMEILGNDFYFGLGCEVKSIPNYDPSDLHPDTGRILRVKASAIGRKAKPALYVHSHGDAFFQNNTVSRFTIYRTGGTASSLTVKYALSGTATKGTDYASLSGSVSIPSGKSSVDLEIRPLSAAPDQGDKQVVLTLSGSSAYERSDPVSAPMMIYRNDVVAVERARDAYESGGQGEFIFRRGAAKPTPLKIKYSVSGTAVKDTDFLLIGTEATIPAGADRVAVPVIPLQDVLVEPSETVIVSISSDPAYIRKFPNTATVLIHDGVSQNSTPVANNQSVTLAEDTSKAITLSATDADGDALTYAIAAQPAHGTLSGTGATRTYTPAADYFGSDSFTFNANDGQEDSNIATVTLMITAADDLPAIQSIWTNPATITLPETTELNVIAADIDSTELVYTWSKVSGPGTVNFSPNGTLTSNLSTASFSAAGHYVFRVTVADDASMVCEDVEVLVNHPMSVGDLIIDNKDANTSKTGTWKTSAMPDPYNGQSLYSTNNATFRWKPTLALSGDYVVYAWWTSATDRSTNVPYNISHANGISTVEVDQSDSSLGGRWVPLGAYRFDAGSSGYVEVSGVNGQACADAVRFVPVIMSEIIVDNKDANTSQTGTWKTSGMPDPFNGQSLYSSNSATFRWNPMLALSGDYVVYAWWTSGSNRSASAPYTISHADGISTVEVDQSDSSLGGRWIPLGAYRFGAGSSGYVEVSGVNGQACADAVRFVPVIMPEIIVDNKDANTSQTGTWKTSGMPDPYNGQSLYSTNSATFRWVPTLALSGDYEVYAWWTSAKDRSVRVPYHISHANGISTVEVDQNDSSLGGRWIRLGAYPFDAGSSGYVEVSGVNGQACADAVRLVPVIMSEIIVDNKDASTSKTGTWKTSNMPDPYNGHSLYSTDGATFRWRPMLALSGDYAVYAWWTSGSSRSKNVPYQISHANGISTVEVDQNDSSLGGRWIRLGAYRFDAGSSGYVEVSGVNGLACADAVRLVPVILSETIVDDKDPDTSKTGTWKTSGRPDPYSGHSRYSTSSDATFRWNPTLDRSGDYVVYAWWTSGTDRMANVPYHISHATGVSTVEVDQNDASLGGRWIPLGAYRFDAGSSGYVEVSGVNGQACADAVRLVPVMTSEIIVDNKDANTSKTGTWKTSGRPDPYSGHSLYSSNSATFRWMPTLASSGDYVVYAWWTSGADRSASVPYHISHANGVSTVEVDQSNSALGGRWVRLGAYPFDAGSSGYVEVSGVNGQACADAVRLVPVNSRSY